MFNKASGMRYYDFMSKLHETIIFDWYMEVGCRQGHSFASVRGKTIAVDPFFRIETNVIGPKPLLFVFQQKSDDFFDSGFLEKSAIKLSLSFLDGMHLFEYLLRDFMNTERNSHPKGAIVLHDCVPSNEKMTTRDLENIPRGGWTGDVWKIIPVLKKYRPDLVVDVLDSKPTGLVIVSKLDPTSNVLAEHYDKIVAEMIDVTIASYGIERFGTEIEMQSTASVMQAGFPMFMTVPAPQGEFHAPAQITP